MIFKEMCLKRILQVLQLISDSTSLSSQMALH